MLQDILRIAAGKNASDIIIGTHRKPSLKVMGSVHVLEEFPPLAAEQVLALLQELGKNEEQIRKLSVEHDMDLGTEVPGFGRYRVNAFYFNEGPGFVVRPIREKVPTFEELGVPLAQFQQLSSYPSGLVLFTGPMGSGKSSSLASVIEFINQNQRKHIVTIEDPIEYRYSNAKSLIEQREIPAHSRSFESALRGALRQAVDVLLVGEMRDLETMSLAMTAAETGSLVFATLHTSGAAGAVDRIINSYPKDHQDQVRTQLGQVLRAVVWQVLLPRKDGQGRIPACEILFNTHGVSNLIRKGETHHIASQMEISRASGMMTMGYAVERLLTAGYIDEEVARPYLMSPGEGDLI